MDSKRESEEVPADAEGIRASEELVPTEETTFPGLERLSQDDPLARYGFTRDSFLFHPLFPAPIVEDLPMVNTEMIMETYELRQYKAAKKRIEELRETNLTNDKIILLFLGSFDASGKIWHTDCNLVDRAVYYLLRKLELGGYFIKIHVGSRTQWLDGNNPWKIDAAYNVTTLPTLMVCDSQQRLTGRRCFNVQHLYLLLTD